MRIDWRTAYFNALHEQDPAKIASAYDHARSVINDAAIELTREARSDHSREREELEEALRELYFHRHRRA